MRDSIVNVVKLFFQWKMFSLFLIMLFYVIIEIIFYYRVGLWNCSLLKDTIYWILGGAFVMFVNFNKVNEEEYYFKKIILDNLKMIFILEFITNFYVYGLIVEVILMPTLLFIFLIDAVAETKKEFFPARKITKKILSLVGLFFVLSSLMKIVADFDSFANIENLESMLLAPLLTISFLPFMYFLALYVNYESFFLRIDRFNQNKQFIKYSKRKIILTCNLNLFKLFRISKIVGIIKIDNENDLRLLLQKAQRR